MEYILLLLGTILSILNLIKERKDETKYSIIEKIIAIFLLIACVVGFYNTYNQRISEKINENRSIHTNNTVVDLEKSLAGLQIQINKLDSYNKSLSQINTKTYEIIKKREKDIANYEELSESLKKQYSNELSIKSELFNEELERTIDLEQNIKNKDKEIAKLIDRRTGLLDTIKTLKSLILSKDILLKCISKFTKYNLLDSLNCISLSIDSQINDSRLEIERLISKTSGLDSLTLDERIKIIKENINNEYDTISDNQRIKYWRRYLKEIEIKEKKNIFD